MERGRASDLPSDSYPPQKLYTVSTCRICGLPGLIVEGNLAFQVVDLSASSDV